MAVRVLEIIVKGRNTYGHLDGFLYVGSDSKGDIKYWKCRNKQVCSARLVTVNTGRNLMIRKGGLASSHSHGPDPEEVEALRVMSSIKVSLSLLLRLLSGKTIRFSLFPPQRAARAHPERPPSAVMREVHNVDEAVQARLPELENIRKAVQRERLRHMPSNPTSIEDLQAIPDQFKKNLVGDNFMLYDSYGNDDDNSSFGRILVFATRENVRVLFKSEIWYVDGTFQTVPSIFFQLFTIMGSVTQTYKGSERKIALPLVYALLETKKTEAYSKVFEVTLSYAETSGIPVRHPITIMSDFEVAIINAVKYHFPEGLIRLCLFHLSQSVYRKIQAEGLQVRYGDESDTSIREAAHSMCALAFVPPEDVPNVFDILHNEVPEDFIPVATYFEINYVRGIRAIGRRKAVKVRYEPSLWNQYGSVLQGIARTNNASEGWHNRFQILVGRNHPSLYSFLTELQKEQAAVEYMLRELNLGKKVKNLPKNSLQKVEERIISIVKTYQDYVDEEKEVEYLKSIGHYIHM